MKQQERLFVYNEVLIVDNFAGGGGASTGIEAAMRCPVDLAINHDAEAVAMHAVNHPHTKHFCEDVFKVDPVAATEGKRVGLAWFSPDCKHFSKAKGGKPVSKKIRGLAWVVVKWAAAVAPEIIMLENVEEFETWGPLLENGMPCPLRKGFTFRRWVKQLQNLGYVVEHRILRACDFGAPTIRKRLYLIARRDGEPIVWPSPTHAKDGAGGLQPYRTAAECIDWSIPCPSIFDRSKPLAENTMRRIARGLQRYVLESASPFIVPMQHQNRAAGIDEPLHTITTQDNKFNLVTPFIAPLTHQGDARVSSIEDPMRTVTGARRGEQAIITPYVARIGQTGRRGKKVDKTTDPLSTVTSKAEHLLVTPFLATYYGANRPNGERTAPLDEALRTQSAENRFGLVAAHLVDVAHGEVSPNGVKRRGKGAHRVDVPAATVAASGNQALVAAFLAQHNTQKGGDGINPGRPADDPLSTITSSGSHQQLVTAALIGVGGPEYSGKPKRVNAPVGTIQTENHRGIITSHLVKLKGTSKGAQPVDEPLHTVTGGGTHHAEVRAFLLKYYGADQDPQLEEPLHTVTSKHRFGLVTIHGVDYQIVDIGMRMLTPRELYRAQGFPEHYIIDFTVGGKPLTKTAQVRMCGNSVCPPVAEALVRANVAIEAATEVKAA